MQSVNQSGAKAGDKVVVFGCGPIGLLALATLADRGVTDTVAVDLSPARLELAEDRRRRPRASTPPRSTCGRS